MDNYELSSDSFTLSDRSSTQGLDHMDDISSEKDMILVTSEKMLEYPEGGRDAYMTLVSSFLGLTGAFGLWNTTGAIESYVASHILLNTSDIAISMVFALFSFILMLGITVSGIIFDKYGGKTLCYVGTLMTTAGLMATANCTELYQFILAFGILTAAGCSLVTSPFVTSIGHYFNKRRGMALSITMPGASIGGIVWPLVCRSLYDKVGFKWTIRTLGFCIGFLLLCGSLLNHDRHEEINRLKKLNEGDKENPTLKEKIDDLVDFKSFKDATFMSLACALFLNEFSLLMVATYIPSYGLSKGFSQSSSLLALTVFNAAGVGGRIIPCYLSDRYGNFNCICTMSIIVMIAVWIVWLPFGDHIGAYFTFAAVFGFGTAGTVSLTPLCTAAISKPKDFGKRYGTAYFCVSFCNLISLPVGMALTKTAAGYQAMIAFTGATCTLATLSFLYTRYRVGGKSMVRV